jgi:pimeloyl-ACP methyl ester carboxylesterase
METGSLLQVPKKPTQFPIQSLLSARLMLAPQLSKGMIYFLSDMSGVISLYRMSKQGGVPEPLLPAGLALQNPHLMAGYNFHIVPKLQKLLVMIDQNGNENYQPSFIPLEGGIPEPIFGETYANQQVACLHVDIKTNLAYFFRDDRKNPGYESLQVNLETMKTKSLGRSLYGNTFAGVNESHTHVVLADGYTAGDQVLYQWQEGWSERRLLYGTPLEERKDQPVKLTNFGTCNFTPDGKGILVKSSLFKDEGSICYMPLDAPNEIREIPVEGLKHEGMGELVDFKQIDGDLFLLEYDIDGSSWLYETVLNGATMKVEVRRVLCGLPPIAQGVELGLEYELGEEGIEYALSYTKASSPSQLYLLPKNHPQEQPHQLTQERVLGIDPKFLSEGEDASFTSFDGLRVSARLYLPSKNLGFTGPRPLVLYVHGGPQGQERPDFTWFSMPLIQYLALNGFAVFVPNVRGSTGYGLAYMKWVDHDWGGKDMQDQIEGLKMLEKDSRIDSTRRAVVGRSYGGYMTLSLASRHPSLWKAACDMFGPYDLTTFVQRLPPSWQEYFYLSIGHPEKDREFLLERSPKTYFENVSCPMLIIQGRNDPRVVERESADVVESLRKRGVEVDYLVFEDEGHDVIKFKNKVTCYTRITDFFLKHLSEKPGDS